MTTAAIAGRPVDDRGDGGERAGLSLPSLREVGRHALPQVVEGALVPLGLFLAVMTVAGVGAAMAAGLGWSGLAIGRRVVRSRRIPTMIWIGVALLLVRLVILVTTASSFLYFLQPTLSAGAVAGAFLVSVLVGRPLARRFAGDLCSLPRSLFRDPDLHRFFQRVSLMWAVVVLGNAGIAFWLLVTQTTTVYLVTQTMLSIALLGGAVAASTLWFYRCVTKTGVLRAV